MKKNILLIVAFACLFSLSLTAQGQTFDEILEKHKGKYGVSNIASLLENGIDAQDNKGNTALYWASWRGYTDIVRLLKAAGARE